MRPFTTPASSFTAGCDPVRLLDHYSVHPPAPLAGAGSQSLPVLDVVLEFPPLHTNSPLFQLM